jgi:HK97 family phage prohead protease
MKLERRMFNAEFRTLRADGKPTQLVGYASVFNVPADMGSFQEVIKPGAFTRTLKEGADVRALFNHNPDFILGRSTDGGKTGTLSLSEDGVGLRYVIDMPDTQLGRDLLTSVERGDITQNSFGFVVRQQQRSSIKGADGQTRMVREITDCDLFDVSPVTYAAYPQTSLEARSAFMYPDGMPEELTKLLTRSAGACDCSCPECQDGDCQDCSADPMCGNQYDEQNALNSARLINAKVRSSLIRL